MGKKINILCALCGSVVNKSKEDTPEKQKTKRFHGASLAETKGKAISQAGKMGKKNPPGGEPRGIL